MCGLSQRHGAGLGAAIYLHDLQVFSAGQFLSQRLREGRCGGEHADDFRCGQNGSLKKPQMCRAGDQYKFGNSAGARRLNRRFQVGGIKNGVPIGRMAKTKRGKDCGFQPVHMTMRRGAQQADLCWGRIQILNDLIGYRRTAA